MQFYTALHLLLAANMAAAAPAPQANDLENVVSSLVAELEAIGDLATSVLDDLVADVTKVLPTATGNAIESLIDELEANLTKDLAPTAPTDLAGAVAKGSSGHQEGHHNHNHGHGHGHGHN